MGGQWPPSDRDVPGDLFAGLLRDYYGRIAMTWQIDDEAPFEVEGSVVDHIAGDRVLWWCPDRRIGFDNRAVAFLRLPLPRSEAACHLACVLAAGERCPVCQPDVSQGFCGNTICRGTGYLRPPAPAWHCLPVASNGSLPDGLAQHSAALLACSAWRVRAGLGAVRGLLRWQSWGTAGMMPGFTRYDLRDVVVGGNPYAAVVGRKGGRGALLDERAETQAKALADGWAVLTPDTVLLPWPTEPPEMAVRRGAS